MSVALCSVNAHEQEPFVNAHEQEPFVKVEGAIRYFSHSSLIGILALQFIYLVDTHMYTDYKKTCGCAINRLTTNLILKITCNTHLV